MLCVCVCVCVCVCNDGLIRKIDIDDSLAYMYLKEKSTNYEHQSLIVWATNLITAETKSPVKCRETQSSFKLS